MLQQILEILKYILPAIVVLIATYVIVNKFLIRDVERKRLAIFQQNLNTSLQLRLQAYERLVIFVERMNSNSLISRYYNNSATVQDLQIAMVQSIRAEFEHNLSQQIYVSNEVWQTVKAAMEQEISMINQIGSTFPMGAPAANFVTKLSEFVNDKDTTSPSSIAMDVINKEAKFVLFPSDK